MFSLAPCLSAVLVFTAFLPLLSKLPVFPLHGWLPEAHVESTTAGSILLASVLLKISVVVFLRLFYVLAPFGLSVASSGLIVLFTLSLFLSSGSLFVLSDFKKVIAYSSIAHMNFSFVGFFVGSTLGVNSGYCLNLMHSIVSLSLFLFVGLLYSLYHSRSLLYFSGLSSVSSFLVYVLLILCLSNISFPICGSFFAELAILSSLLSVSLFCRGFIYFSLFLLSSAFVLLFVSLSFQSSTFSSLFAKFHSYSLVGFLFSGLSVILLSTLFYSQFVVCFLSSHVLASFTFAQALN